MSAEMTSAGTTLALHDLTVALETDAGFVHAVEGLELAMRRGETFALVGESGCGKSITALALMRLLPDAGQVTRGAVQLDGTDLLDLPEAAMRGVRGGRVAMIFQEPATSLNPVMKVGAQIIEAIETHTPLRGAAARARALDWLRRVGIPEPERRIDDYPFRLFGGQKQRVMIAIALAAEPDFLVADEPTTALDVTVQRQILDLLRELQRERALGLLLITHDLGVVAGMAHRVALMYAGQIVEVAEADDFFARPRHPYAHLLLAALPDAAQRGMPLAAIPGTVPPPGRYAAGCRFAARCGFAAEVCRQAPPLLPCGPSHAVRCVRHAEVPAWRPREPEVAVRQNGHATTVRTDGREATTALLRVEGLSVRFPQRGGLLQRVRSHHTAVEDVSFQLDAGRTLALVGESGCGKTTAAKALLQLLRGQAEVTGQALLHGQDLFALQGNALQGNALQRARREIQIVFQDPYASLNPRLRVHETLEEGLVALRPELDAAARRRRLEALLDRVGLERGALGRFPHEFSGGQRQRLAIARALAVEPRVIVCDEPTSALDVSVQAQILNLLRELQREAGLAYLFITHNLGVVAYLADEVAVMHQGRIVERGAVEDVFAAPRSAVTRRLLDAVPRLDTHVPY